jgi:hypothetical protein
MFTAGSPRLPLHSCASIVHEQVTTTSVRNDRKKKERLNNVSADTMNVFGENHLQFMLFIVIYPINNEV